MTDKDLVKFEKDVEAYTEDFWEAHEEADRAIGAMANAFDDLKNALDDLLYELDQEEK